MIRKSVVTEARERTVAHAGKGRIDFSRVFRAEDFETDLAFIDYAEIPPGSSIGVHTHGENEEVYFIVEGEGLMTTEGERCRVRRGDVIVNRRGWSHGLENDGSLPLKILVWEVAYRP